MEIVKADWLCHLKDSRKGSGPSSIFSISVDASGRRLASAGLDSTIRVWNLDALNKPNEPKLLAAMTRHDGAVLCVKWSPVGAPVDCLASAADDSIILIWRREQEGPAAGGAFDFDHDKLGLNPPVEMYRPIHRLTDHSADVAGLEWSHDGRWLASCGLDGTIIIWDVMNGFKLVERLEGHKGFVKGLAWDPLGVYLASQSDDHSLIIWRTHDWKAETTLKKPFDQGNEETFFRRPSWSPDGKFLATANAVNGRQPVISLISRDQWKPEVAFVGHLLAVEVARFSPYFYKRSGSEEVSYICAAGSQDCNTSIWTDKSSKPIAVLTDLFEHAVMDIEWLSNGMTLLIAAYDGTIARVKFNEGFAGRPLLGHEMKQYLNSLSKGQVQNFTEQLPTSMQQVRLADELERIKSTTINPDDDVKMKPSVTLTDISSSIEVTRVKQLSPIKSLQKESVTKEGKRRVAPLLVQECTRTPLTTPSTFGTEGGIPLKQFSTPIMKAPSIQKRLYVSAEEFSIEVTNLKAIGSMASETKVQFSKNNSIIWDDIFEAHVLLLSMDKTIVCFALNNKTLIVCTSTGRRLCPALTLEGSPISMDCKDNECLLIVDTGRFYYWDLLKMILVRSGNIVSVSKGISIASITKRPDTSFSVSFTDGRSFDYIPRLDCFVQTNSGVFHMLEYEYAKENRTSLDDISLVKEALAADVSETSRNSIVALESRLSLSALQCNISLFTKVLATYIRRMVREGLKDRLLEVLIDIAGSTGFNWLEFDRRAIIKALTPLLSSLPESDSILEEVNFVFDTQMTP